SSTCGADVGQGAGACDPRFPPCAASPPPCRSEPLGTLGDGKRRPPLAGPHQSTRTPTTGGRPPDSGVDMATQNYGTRGLGAAAAAGAAFALGALTVVAAYQRWYADPHRRTKQLDAQRTRLADYQRLQLRLLDKAMDDPEL